MDEIRELKRQRNWLLLAAFPFLPLIAVYAVVRRGRKKRKNSDKPVFETFARFHNRQAGEIREWMEAFKAELDHRLRRGNLHEMVSRVRRLEPLVPEYGSETPVLLLPFSIEPYTKMINSMLELQSGLEFSGADIVVVTSNDCDGAGLVSILGQFGTGGEKVLVMDTSRDDPIALRQETFNIFAASPQATELSEIDVERVLFELIRSLHPKHVVIADSAMMWNVMSAYGKALLASATVSAYFSAQDENEFTSRYFYRFAELLGGIHVADKGAKERLVERYVLCAADAARITVLGSVGETKRTLPALLPSIGGTDSEPLACDGAVDISLIVTVHNETVVTGMSMLAANASVKAAETAGFVVEKLIALDDATDVARASMSNPVYADWRVLELSERDLGRARNRAVRMSRGKYIAFLDADDLFSENWLAEAARVLDNAADAGERVIAHPEINWIFDGEDALVAVTPQDSPVFSPALFYFTNYYDSLCMVPRQAHLDFPYVSRDIPNGLSYQDQQFAVETLAAGWRRRAAPNTIIFKRRRDTSLVTESRDQRAVIRQVDALAIENIPRLIVPPTPTP
ncbi:MAG: glycosyltransferase [Pseudomonadota bacterium]